MSEPPAPLADEPAIPLGLEAGALDAEPIVEGAAGSGADEGDYERFSVSGVGEQRAYARRKRPP